MFSFLKKFFKKNDENSSLEENTDKALEIKDVKSKVKEKNQQEKLDETPKNKNNEDKSWGFLYKISEKVAEMPPEIQETIVKQGGSLLSSGASYSHDPKAPTTKLDDKKEGKL